MKKNYIYIMLLLIVIGFATITNVLFVNGGILIGTNSSDFDVYYSKVIMNNVEKNELILDDKNITFEYTFKSKEDRVSLEYYITNGSTMYDASIRVSCLDDSDYLKIENSWIDDTIIAAQTTQSGILNVSLKKLYSGDDILNHTISCEINAEASKRSSIVPIIEEDNTMTGIVKKRNDNVVENVTSGYLAFVSDNKSVTEVKETGKFRVSGLTNSKYDVYYFNEADPNDVEADELSSLAMASGTFRTDVISKELVLNCNEGKCSSGEQITIGDVDVFESPNYSIDLIGDNVTISNQNLSGKFCNSVDVKIKPEFDYYIDSVSCTNGYTSEYESGLSSTEEQIIKINLPDDVYESTCSINTKQFTCDNNVGKTWRFDYLGNEQNFIVPCSGIYKLETWGAQGSVASQYGSYSVGTMRLLRNQNVYVNTGEKGKTSAISYNSDLVAKGGYSHMASISGLYPTLNNDSSKILISAGDNSGNISNSLLKEKSIYCYNCQANDDENNKIVSTTCSSGSATSQCTKQGNGYAKITYLGKKSSGIGILGTPSGYGGSNGGSWVNIPEGSEYLLANVEGTSVRNCELVNCDGLGYNCSSSSAYAFVSFYNDAGTQIGSTNKFGSNVSNYRINIPAEATRAKFQTQYSSNKDMNNCYMEISSSTNSKITAVFYGPSAEAGSIIGTISGSSGITDIPKETNFMMVNVRGTSNGIVKQFNCDGLHNVYCNVNANAYVEFYDDNNVKVGNTITYSTDKTNLRLEVPEGATKIRVSNEYKKTTVDPDMCYIDKFSCDTTSSIILTFHGDI